MITEIRRERELISGGCACSCNNGEYPGYEVVGFVDSERTCANECIAVRKFVDYSCGRYDLDNVAYVNSEGEYSDNPIGRFFSNTPDISY